MLTHYIRIYSYWQCKAQMGFIKISRRDATTSTPSSPGEGSEPLPQKYCLAACVATMDKDQDQCPESAVLLSHRAVIQASLHAHSS